ncbi:MAG TPA: isoleucine--tRNA ligase [Actinomycetota bacterium]|jgi:isoleucyl-tRNA synthetase|nr:isoleucine--tRNA ligase [Actinomycetota bacterium]
MAFEPVDPKASLPEQEAKVLAFWREADVFHRQLERRKEGPLWVFYEGPPTANGKPGIHHTEPRTFKDVYPRYRAMTGHHVPRKAGWDCHGLPVELEVEKEIGTKNKRDIEAFGIAEFNRLCRESVLRYVDDFERLTERLGFWIDLSEAYWTMDTEYIESVWWSLKQLHGRGLLYQDHRVTWYCPRCGTALSDHETAQGYELVEDPSVYVLFHIVDAPDPSLAGAATIGWTTTPWTLVSNEGLAVSADAPYVVVDHDGERLVLAEALKDAVLPDDPVVAGPFPGRSLDGLRYEPLYPNVEGAHRIVLADFVSLEEGTGIVHMAPGFGPEDLDIGRREGWLTFQPLDGEGRFTTEAPEFVRGLFFKDADPPITEDLRERGLLLSAGTIDHVYPLCWRCSTPLINLARTSWYIRTTEVKDRLLDVNEGVNWYPDHIKHGRYGDWLRNNVDWGLSRERYWGTPLPIWRCTNGHDTAVGSLSQLSELAGRDVTGIDPHRPAIDEVTFECPQCGAPATRLLEVLDAWYDSGAMPYAQWGYHPELGRGLERFRERFPADFISEAIDQTRGWFYTLMAEGVLHFDSTAYETVVVLGHIVDENGRKMSKSLGNVIDPFDVLDRQGADALRWFLLTNGSPWESRRIGMVIMDEIVRQFMLPIRNVYAFFVTYANASGFDPSADDPVPVRERPPLDRWIRSRLERTVEAAREGLEEYNATGVGRDHIAKFVDDLSSWYVRRARPRFWDPNGRGGEDSRSAFHTLHECLVTLSQLLAPFTPFIAEEMWRNLAAGRNGSPDSVHLTDYPTADEGLRDRELDSAMLNVRKIAELGRRVRAETKMRLRQPLLEAVVHFPGDHAALEPLLPLLAEELNVKRVIIAESADHLGRWRAKPNFKVLGPKLGGRVKDVANVLGRDDGALAGRLAAGESVELTLDDGSSAELGPVDVDLAQEKLEGWGVGSEGGITVALELDVTTELRREGLARDVIRLVQDARKAAGLDVSDRIVLGIGAMGEVAEAMRDDGNRSRVTEETLASVLNNEPLPDATYSTEADLDGDAVTVTLRRT